jgi:hypothetical protein
VYTYTINPPTFTMPAAGGSTVACISNAQVVPTAPVVNNSCGDPLSPTGPVVSPDPACSGTKTYTWTYTDCTGNTGQWVYTYTINPPTFTLPPNGSSTVACLADAQVVPQFHLLSIHVAIQLYQQALSLDLILYALEQRLTPGPTQIVQVRTHNGYIPILLMHQHLQFRLQVVQLYLV